MIKFTRHSLERMNNRGISKEMIMLTIQYGENIKDKIILNCKIIKNILTKVNVEMKSKLLKLLDKGGITVVMADDASIITVYNCNR
ncbi:MAG: hypothetical protein DRG78_15255 [Epsilonproteobacteria bacterium]|nr:MAG: hypothetical protein DRG78_15255 [Campylobacterota bacterium]